MAHGLLSFAARMSPKEQRALEAILHRATVDFDFRQALLTSPREAIQLAYGVRIPAHFHIKFIERDADVDALVVLPDFQQPNGELSDDSLDGVSGGTGSGTDPSWSDGIT
jgi:hypothetical protein